MIGNLLGKIMGSSLLKNYDVDKEPYMHGGLHNLWKVYRGKKKDRNMMDVSVFIFEKKTLDKKKLSQNQKDEIITILRKDPSSLAKLKHPNLLSLIEQPLEDQKFLIFVTEPVELNLSCLQFDATKKDMIPGNLEIKCLAFELMDALNFLHNNAKMIHMGLAPEHVYITKDGKLKLGGLNFAQQFSTAESLNVPLNYDLRINEYSVVPNLRFAAPEVTESNQCSINSDLFSVGAILYYMEALNKGKNPFILNQTDITDKSSHTNETGTFYRKFQSLIAGFDNDFEIILSLLTSKNPLSRGPTNQVSVKTWFQDPLLKTIKYLETLDGKDHINKVQFLQGITKILEKFDKKALLKKVIPLLLDQMKIIQLSVNVLPNILMIMERPNFLTTTEFREFIWPDVQKLCKAKELPAQSLFLILKNTELFMKYVGPTEFQQNFLILINKSLECGVAKLQFLALTKVPIIIKQIEYNTVKSAIIPRILMILEKPGQVELKQKTLDIILEIISIIDQQTMKDKILKTFEKVRAIETDPQICMLLLKIYEQMAKVLGVEEIGLKILPGIIPMLISGSFTRNQFKELILSVRRLLDQIEQHREKDLREMGQDPVPSSNAFDLDLLEKSMGFTKSDSSAPQVTNQDVFDFLSSLESRPTEQRQQQTNGGNSGQNQGFGNGNNGGQEDIMSTMNNIAQPHQQQQQVQQSNNPFDNIVPPSQQQQQQTFGQFGNIPQQLQQQKPQVMGWDSEIQNFGAMNNFSAVDKKKEEEDFFTSLAFGQPKNQNNLNNQWGNIGSSSNTNQQINKPSMPQKGGLNLNFGSVANASKLNDDPFADLIDDKPQNTGINLGFNNNQQQQSNTFVNNFGNQGNTNNPISFGQQQQQQPQQQNQQFVAQQNNPLGGSNNPSFNQMALGGGFSSLNLNDAGFGGNQQNRGQPQQQQNFGGQNNAGGFNQSLAFGGNNLGQGNQSMAFGNSNNTNTMANNSSTFGAFPAPKVNQQNNAANNLGNNDDFFSQFTNPNNQQNKQQNNPFGNLI